MSAAKGKRPRLQPSWPLPEYTYVPGKFPHPVSDPAGHSFGQPPIEAVPLDLRDWRQCPHYLAGLDLFNQGYHWEAHEVWEAVWHACERRGPAADFLKGLIKLAAAAVKLREGRAAGVVRHARRATQLWQQAADSLPGCERIAGLALADLHHAVDELQRLARQPLPESSPESVRPLIDQVLWPQA